MNRENHFIKDIQVNSQQKVIDTLLILKEAGILQELDEKRAKVKSVRRGMFVNIIDTYEEEHINTGDILELM
jgi:hypothetical protein